MPVSSHAAALELDPPVSHGAALIAPDGSRHRRMHGRSGGLCRDDGLAGVEKLMLDLAGGTDGGGFVGFMVRQHLGTGGKRLRARLALAAHEALGRERWAAIPWAAACELLHNATLVHDDLQDGDEMRRGHPTVWARHGAAQAVNAGDLLLMLPFLALERGDAPPHTRFALAAAIAARAAEVVRGQSAEIALGAASTVTRDAYLRAVDGKTGALFQLPVEGAAFLAGLPREQARSLGAAFRGVGVLFQLQDDVLDLYGDKGRGRAGMDLREGKVSALVVEHLEIHPGDGLWLRTLLALPRDRTPDAEVERAIARFRDGGALTGVLLQVARLAREVADAPALRAEPALRRLACDLVAVALEPIAHVDGFPREHLAAAETFALEDA